MVIGKFSPDVEIFLLFLKNFTDVVEYYVPSVRQGEFPADGK
jgi:hypothetical protein